MPEPIGSIGEGPLRSTAAVVDELLADKHIGLGLQLSVRCRNLVVDHALGESLGGPLAIDHLHNIYCAAKPLLSLGIGHLVDESLVDLDRPVQEVLGDAHPLLPPWSITPSEILCHDAGLAAPNAMSWRMTPQADRMALIDYEGHSRSAEYSELLGGLILEALIERVAAVAASEFVMERVVRPLGLDDGIVFDVATRLPEVLPRVRVPFGGLPEEAIPLLSERIPSEVQELRPAFGGLATMAAMSALYAALGRLHHGLENPALPSSSTFAAMLLRRRGWSYDPIMKREIDFAGGFMCDLGGGGMYDDIGPDSFGHNGGFVTTIAFYDPRADLSLALYFNGIVVDVDRGREPRRRLVAAVYRDLRDAGLIGSRLDG